LPRPTHTGGAGAEEIPFPVVSNAFTAFLYLIRVLTGKNLCSSLEKIFFGEITKRKGE
jgi:hypothetical protein